MGIHVDEVSAVWRYFKLESESILCPETAGCMVLKVLWRNQRT